MSIRTPIVSISSVALLLHVHCNLFVAIMKGFTVALAALSLATSTLAAPTPQQDERFKDVNCADYQESDEYTVEEFIEYCEVAVGCPTLDLMDQEAVWGFWERTGRNISYRLGTPVDSRGPALRLRSTRKLSNMIAR